MWPLPLTRPSHPQPDRNQFHHSAGCEEGHQWCDGHWSVFPGPQKIPFEEKYYYWPYLPRPTFEGIPGGKGGGRGIHCAQLHILVLVGLIFLKFLAQRCSALIERTSPFLTNSILSGKVTRKYATRRKASTRLTVCNIRATPFCRPNLCLIKNFLRTCFAPPP